MLPTRITDGGLSSSGIVDRHNCTIVAIAVAGRISYKLAYSLGVAVGRRRGTGFSSGCIIHEARRIGIRSRIVRLPKPGRITVERFVELHPKGRFYVCATGHALALIDGVIHDQIIVNPRSRVRLAWHVYPQRKPAKHSEAE